MSAVESTPEIAEQKPKKRRRFWRFFRWFLLFLVVGLWAFYVWQPWVYEVFPRPLPSPNPRVDPDSAKLFSKGTKVLVVTGHPDDPEFYVGGTLLLLGRAGAQITLICCTDGDKAYYPFEDFEANRRTRQVEQRNALAAWRGENAIFLGFPDGRLKANEELIGKLADQIRAVQPDHILTFDPVYAPRFSHSDHRQTGEAMSKAAKLSGFKGWMLLFSTRASNFFVNISKEWPEKKSLLSIHKSQFYGERLKRIERMVEGSARAAGKELGVTHAEGFRCLKFQ